MVKGVSVNRYFTLSTWLVAMAAFALAIVSDVFSLQALTGIPVTLAIGIYFRKIRNTIGTNFIIPTLCWLQISWAVFEMSLSKDVVYLGDGIALLMVLNLLNLRASGRYWIVMVGSLLLCFSGLVLEPGVVGYILFLVFLALATLSLNSANLFLNIDKVKDLKLTLDRNYFWNLLKSTPLGVLLAISVFVMFPRINKLALEMPFKVKQRFKTGYNGAIDLSGQGNIAENDTVVMHISASDLDWLEANARHLYLRGSTLDTFTGSHWSKNYSDPEAYQVFQPIHVNIKTNLQRGKDLELTTTPMHSKAIFIPEGGFLLKEMSKSVELMFLDRIDGSLSRVSDSPKRYRYIVRQFPKLPMGDVTLASLRKLLTEEHAVGKRPYNLPKNYLPFMALPDQMANAEYWQAFTKNFDVDERTTVDKILEDLQSYFRTNYQATLINSFTGKSTFQRFLTSDHYGHCELFATASVMLLRHFGIPSRVVTGYRGGEFNPIADAVVVKELHAHAWAEYFIPGSGWHLFDGTPAIVGQYNREQSSGVFQYLHAANYYLDRYLVDYDLGVQREIVENIKKNMSMRSKSPELSFKYLIILVIIGGIIFAIYGSRKKLIRQKQEVFRPDFYKAFLKLVFQQHNDLVKRPYETFTQFHTRLVANSSIDPDLIRDVDQALHETLYAERQLDPKKIDDIRARISEAYYTKVN